MNSKGQVKGTFLFACLGLAACSQSIVPEEKQVQQPQQQQIFEEWDLKPGSVYDGDTLRVIRDNEELKIRFCGIDAPEKKMAMGVESRDHLRSLVEIGKGELLLRPIEKDRYGRTVAEVYVQDSEDTAINLNVQMVRDGYAWHYERYSNTCPVRGEFALAQKAAQSEGIGIWDGNPQPPWEWRKVNN